MTITGSHSHVGSQTLGEVATALLMCSCGCSSQMVCRVTFNSSVVLGFGLSLWRFSSMEHDCPDVIVDGFNSGWFQLMDTEQPVLHDALMLRNGDCLG